MNYLRLVGRGFLVLLCANVVLTAQTSSQPSDQYPQPPAQETTAVSLETPDYANDTPAHIAVVDGTATIERDGRVEKAEENIILLAGDRLRTERGRVEVLFDDGSALDLDHDTRLDLMSDSLVRLLAGRIRLTIARTTNALDYRVDAAPGSVWIKAAGDYRIGLSDTRSGDVELGVTVLRGSAELRNTHGMTLVRAGTYAAVTTSTAPSLPLVSNSAQWDEFDRWVEDQRDGRYGVESVRYLPEEIRYYGGAFDQYGSWDYIPVYGHVWYPRVAVGWRPYYHGRWSFAARFGWFWVGFDRYWGYPTHHYGRWGYGSNRWFWIPGHRWSPACVSWAYAPGYVSWCPLGFNNRPVIGINNVFVGNPWPGWTFVPRRAFVPNVLVARHAVLSNDIAPGTSRQFTARPNAPVAPAGLVARAQPLRAPTRSYAVPRGSSSGGPAFDSGSGAGFATAGSSPGQSSIGASPSRPPTRIQQSRPGGSISGDARPDVVTPSASSDRAFPRLASPPAQSSRPDSSGSASRTSRARPQTTTPDPSPDRGVGALPRNYSPEPRPSSPDSAFRSRQPGTQRSAEPSTPEPRAFERRAVPSVPRNYSPEPRQSSPDSGFQSRLPSSQRSAPELGAPEPRAFERRAAPSGAAQLQPRTTAVRTRRRTSVALVRGAPIRTAFGAAGSAARRTAVPFRAARRRVKRATEPEGRKGLAGR